MRSFAENNSRDLYIGSNNQLVSISEAEALAQITKTAIESQLGEMIYAVDSGMPTDSVVWSGTPNLQQFEFYARKNISAVSGVTGIVSFEAEIVDDTITYTAVISTEFGEVATGGSV